MTLSGKFRGKYHLLQSIQSGLGLGLDRGDNTIRREFWREKQE